MAEGVSGEDGPGSSWAPAWAEAMRRLANELGRTPFTRPSELAGMPVTYRDTMPRDVIGFRGEDEESSAVSNVVTGRITRVVKLSDESLDEALDRVAASQSAIDRQNQAMREMFDRIGIENRPATVDVNAPWFIQGIEVIHRLNSAMYLPDWITSRLCWLLSPEVAGSGAGRVMALHGITVKVVPGISPHLGFDLEVS